jgi:hypothetical protein
MRDGSVPAFVCRDPDLHREWKTKLVVVALFAFAAGVIVQWTLNLLP